MERQEGYYWTKSLGFDIWEPTEYNGKVWDISTIEDIFVDDSYFDEINETRIPSPDEVSKHRVIKNGHNEVVKDANGDFVLQKIGNSATVNLDKLSVFSDVH